MADQGDVSPEPTDAKPCTTALMPTYYRQHAQAYATATRDVDMAPLYARFEPLLPAGARVLDVGCGSGRDALAFAQRGYQVTAFDASPELAQLAAQHTGLPVGTADVRHLHDATALGLQAGTLFDGIWACASLLHLPEADQPSAWQRLWALLKPVGVVYASYKLGDEAHPSERVDNLGRPFTDATEARVAHWLRGLPHVAQISTWVTADQRPASEQAWLNVLVQRQRP